MRLAKYLAHSGVASRRGAEEIIRAGRVSVGEERGVRGQVGHRVGSLAVRAWIHSTAVAVHLAHRS